MSFSLNEVEATAKKATRGAGYPWGLAEEAGRATRWLCAQGLDGCGALAHLLGAGFAKDLPAHAPNTLPGPWLAATPLCPLITGAALSDNATALTNKPFEIGPVVAPMLILPFVAAAARQIGNALAVSGPEFTAMTDGTTISLSGTAPQMASSLTIATGVALGKSQPTQSRAMPAASDWDTLNRFAQLTYAPATEESRLLGAGAGLSDND